MLKIIAIASEDGWAFVDRDGEVLLIKPAYSQSNLLATSRVSTGTMDEPELRESVLRMLNDCAEGMLGCDLDRWELSQEVDVAKQFPVLADAQDPDAVKKLAQEVAEKHQVFEVGAAA